MQYIFLLDPSRQRSYCCSFSGENPLNRLELRVLSVVMLVEVAEDAFAELLELLEDAIVDMLVL